METTLKQRLIKFIKSKGLSQGRFDKLCNLNQGYVSHINNTPNTVKTMKHLPLETAINLFLQREHERKIARNIKNSNVSLAEVFKINVKYVKSLP